VRSPMSCGENTGAPTTANVVELLDAWQPTVIKGNAAEIGALAGSNEVCRRSDPKMTLDCD
jgi:hydroxyethylthiazole kinase-like sugar kinase family protein